MCVFVFVCVRACYEEHASSKGSNFKNKDFLSNFSPIRESDILVAHFRKQLLTG